MMKLRERLRWIREDWKAKRRGEVRVAPRGASGRVYAKEGQYPSEARSRAGAHQARAKATVTVGIKVIRADGTVEDHGTHPATLEEKPNG